MSIYDLILGMLVVSIISMSALGLYGMRFIRKMPAALPYSLLMFATAGWAFCYAIDLSITSLPQKVLFHNLRFLFLPFLSFLELWLVIAYVRRMEWLKKELVALLLVFPVITVVLALTSPYHTLFRYNFWVDTTGPLPVLQYTESPLFTVYLFYNLALLILTLAILVYETYRKDTLREIQTILLFIALAFPTVVNYQYSFGFSPVPGVNMTTPLVWIAAIFYTIAIFRYRFLDIVPVARSRLIETMSAIVLVLNMDGRIIDANPAARSFFSLPEGAMTRQLIGEVVTDWEEFLSLCRSEGGGRRELVRGSPAGMQVFMATQELFRTPLGEPEGRLILLQDITEQKRAEEKIARLASFPQLTPVMIFEVNQTEQVLFTNPAMQAVLNALAMTSPHPFIPKDIHSIIREWDTRTGVQFTREMSISGRQFLETSYLSREFASARFYITDITDRKKAENALLREKEFSASIIDTTGDTIFVFEPATGKAVRWNRAFREVSRYTDEEIAAKNAPADWYSDEDLAKASVSTAKILKGEAAVFEMSLITKDKRRIPTEYQASGIRGADGTIRYIIAIGRDLTERRKSEQVLRESEARFRTILDQASDAIIIHDENGHIINVNKKACQNLGYTHEELLLLSIKDIDPEAIETGKDQIWKKIILGATVTFESRQRRKDGSLFPVEITLGPINLKNEVLVIGIIHDITDRKRVEESLKESEERFREVFDQSVAGKSLTSALDGRLLRINKAFADMLGYTQEELQQMNWAEVTYPDDIPESTECVRCLLAGEKTSYRMEKRYIHKTGTIVWCDVGTSLMRDADGKPLYLMTTIMDITERKKAEEALRETRDYLQNLIRYANAPIIVWDPVFRITEFNRAFESLTGLHRDEVIGRHLHILFPPDSCTASMEKIRNTLLGEQWEVVEIPIRHVSGQTRTVLWNSANIKDPQGTIIATIAQGQDITERKRAEDALRESETRYHEFFTTSRDCIFITSWDGRWIDFNDTAMEMFGFDNREELMAVPIGSLYEYPEERGRFTAKIAKDGYVKEFPVRLKKKDGTIIDTLITAVPLKSADGSIRAFVGSIRNITERKRAGEELQETKDYLENLIRYANAPIIVWDPGFRITEFNRAFESLTGLRRDEVIGRHLHILFPPDSCTASMEKIRNTLLGEQWEVVEIPIRHVSGQTRTVLWNSANIKDPQGTIIATIAQGQDITERKAVERQRELLITELEQKNAELERFTYTVSHDLKSPIITIRGFLGLLTEDAKRGDAIQMESDIRRIISATDKIQALLEDLLTLSRIGRVANPPEVINFGTIAEEAIELLAGAIRKHGIHVTIVPDLPDVFVDHTRIREVMVNLIENAIKFRGDQPAPIIEIGIRYEENGPVFFVKDNGIGIDPAYAQKIFGLFEKLDPKTEGTGVGLTIVRRIIEVHGGTIWVESPGLGQGSTFCFTLPMAEKDSIYKPQNGKVE